MRISSCFYHCEIFIVLPVKHAELFKQREAAAIEAGFEGPDMIGPYMRTLILMHRDTIGVAIK
jgi:hypothetical protein